MTKLLTAIQRDTEQRQRSLPTNISIIEAMEDERYFGSLFKDQETWNNWKVFLKAVFELEMTEAEQSTFSSFTGRQRAPSAPVSEAFAMVGRRGGKSFVSAVVACYLALFRDWRPFLAPGETGWIFVVAADRQQARIVLGYIKSILHLPQFVGLIDRELLLEIHLKN